MVVVDYLDDPQGTLEPRQDPRQFQEPLLTGTMAVSVISRVFFFPERDMARDGLSSKMNLMDNLQLRTWMLDKEFGIKLSLTTSNMVVRLARLKSRVW